MTRIARIFPDKNFKEERNTSVKIRAIRVIRVLLFTPRMPTHCHVCGIAHVLLYKRG